MKHKKRTSESNEHQKLVEYTQGGILIRFNEKKAVKEKTTTYKCTEFWFEVDEPDIEGILEKEGFILTDEHKKLLK